MYEDEEESVHMDLKLETVTGTRLPYRPRTRRPKGMVSWQVDRSVSARVRSGRKNEGQMLKSMKTRSVMVVSGGGDGSTGDGEVVVVVVVEERDVVERKRRERRVKGK